VPFGYICGFPVGGISSELYGYYAGQLAMQSQQGSAVKEAVSTWSIEHGQVRHSRWRWPSATVGDPKS
jgi:hypothetical protein